MSSSNPYQKYKATSITSASREKLLLMMYEGAIKHTKLAIQACDEKRIADRCTHIGKAWDIVMELNNTLDHKLGGPLAAQLEQLYMFITDQYMQCNLKNGDPAPLQAALKILNTLYEGWVAAVEKLKQEGVDINKLEKNKAG